MPGARTLQPSRSPLEAGVGVFVKAAGRTFVGKEAMRRRKAETGHWNMHLLELDDNAEDPFYTHTVLQNDRAIGQVTSGSFGHRVKKSLALAYFSEPPDGSPLSVLILGKAIAAKILHEIPYDPESRLMRA